MERLPHQVGELIELALPELRQRANQHQLVVDVSPHVAARSVLVDARRIELVLANLVENAAKYSPAKTNITLLAACDDQQATFQVRDEGPGIALPERAYIFDRFYRARTNRRGIFSQC